MIAKTLAAAALLAAAIAAPTAASASAYHVGAPAKVIVGKHSSLNVRAEPGFHGYVVGSIPAWGKPFVHACRPGHGGEWCKVIGIMEKRGELLGFSQDDFVLLPYGTAKRLMGASRDLDIQIQLLVDDIGRQEEVKERIRRVLRQEHGLKPGEPDDFRVQTPEQLAESFNTVINTITAVSAGIVGISLLVGGIGIMNIMLVSVTERTREIGILKALGATRQDVLLQFLIEAVTLCMIGGLLGVAIGYGLGALVATLLPGFPPAHVPLWAVLLSFGFCAAVGIVFGIVPAAKAAQLDPIDALRYE